MRTIATIIDQWSRQAGRGVGVIPPAGTSMSRAALVSPSTRRVHAKAITTTPPMTAPVAAARTIRNSSIGGNPAPELSAADATNPASLRSRLWRFYGAALFLHARRRFLAELRRAPKIPARDGAIGRPASPVFGERLGCRLRAFLESESEALADTIIVDRQHIGAAESEHQEHLGGPAADATHRGEALDHRRIVEPVRLGEGGDGAVRRFAREVA